MRGRLLADIANLLDEIEAGPITQSRWEDHELRWQGHVTDLRGNLVASMGKIMLAFEAMAKHEPEKITPEVAKLLYWWQNENGREESLGELPIERRRALEEAARKLPKRRE